jgi:hypothetical protein
MAECATQGTALEVQAQQLQRDLEQMMRRFGRQCRGIGKVFVTLVRQTERQLLQMGAQVLPLARAAQEYLHSATRLLLRRQVRRTTQLTAALEAHHRIAHQSRRLTQGKALAHCKIVNAYDPPIAHTGGRPPEPGQSGLARHPDPDPGAPRLRVWLQPPGSRERHCQPAVSWRRAAHVQRSSRCHRANGDGGHGPQRGHLGAHP